MARVTRRTILGGAAASVMAASAMRATAAQATRSVKPVQEAGADVVVIGAGLSGLSSALLLEETGLEVRVLEARDRVGGRVFTRFDLPGYPEVGGNTFGAGYGRVLDVVRRMELPLADFSNRRARFRKTELVINGQIVPKDAWPKSPANKLSRELRERMPWELGSIAMAGPNPLAAPEEWRAPSALAHDVPFHDFLAARGVEPEVIRLAYSENPYFGTSAHDVSALMYCFNQVWGAGQRQISSHQYSIQGGNQKLPQAMAASLKSPVHLNREVVSVSTDPQGVTVHCADGSRYRARRVICSLPYSVVRSIRFDPVLRGAHAVAVSSMSYMINTLVFLRPLRAFWEDDGLSPAMWTDGMLGTVSAQHFGETDEEVTCLVVNPRGFKAAYLDRLPREEAIRRVIAEIESIRPAARGALECTGYHSWHQDPYAAGDWSVFAPGHITRFGDAIISTHGHVHFCGEHTALANRGMEAALESAERAAIEVMTSL